MPNRFAACTQIQRNVTPGKLQFEGLSHTLPFLYKMVKSTDLYIYAHIGYMYLKVRGVTITLHLQQFATLFQISSLYVVHDKVTWQYIFMETLEGVDMLKGYMWAYGEETMLSLFGFALLPSNVFLALFVSQLLNGILIMLSCLFRLDTNHSNDKLLASTWKVQQSRSI